MEGPNLWLLVYGLTCFASSFKTLDMAVGSSSLEIMVFFYTAVCHLDHCAPEYVDTVLVFEQKLGNQRLTWHQAAAE